MKPIHYIRVGNKRQLLQEKVAVAYIRTASSEGFSEHLEAQLKSIKEFAEANNIRIKYVYQDLGVSSFNSFYQKGLDELIDKVKNNNIDFVLVTEPSRISRKIINYMNFENKLRRFGTHILPISNVKGMI